MRFRSTSECGAAFLSFVTLGELRRLEEVATPGTGVRLAGVTMTRSALRRLLLLIGLIQEGCSDMTENDRLSILGLG